MVIRTIFIIVLVHLCLINVSADENNNSSTQKLSYKWENRELHSPMAKTIAEHQSKCSHQVYYHGQRNYGMGSDLHIWTQAVCNSMQTGSTLLQLDEPWIWNDRSFCKPEELNQPLNCYFNIQKHCPGSVAHYPKQIKWTNEFTKCPKFIHDLPSRQIFRAAAIEYLFSNLNPRLIDETEQNIIDIFGSEGIPKDLITVHVRWGDKSLEMKLVHENDYYTAIENIINKHNISNPHVFITTESMDGVVKLQDVVNKNNKSWKLHYYAPSVFNANTAAHISAKPVVSPMDMARVTQGTLGKASLISLLLAMEGKHYVLTSGSNWSRLIDELRLNIVDVACGGCTNMVDLREGIPAAQNWRA